MTHYIGLDAHSKTCTAVVTDESGNIQQKAQFSTTDAHLLEFVKSIKKPRSLAFEEMNISQWLFVLLKDHVDDLAIANTPHLTPQRGAKTDFIDAVRLATELRCNTINRVHHEDSKLWDLRVLVTSYGDFTKDFTRLKNRYKSFFRSRGLFVTGQGVYRDEDLLKQLTKDHDKFVAQSMFENIKVLTETKKNYDKRFEKLAKQWKIISNLCSIPGISFIRAAVIAALVCTPERFANKHKFWAYTMLVRHFEESDGKMYGSKKIRGRSELKAVFMGAATSVLVSSNTELRSYYDKLRSKGIADKNAKKSVARRIAAIALTIMKTGCTYDDHHQEKRIRLEKKLAN